MTDYDADEPVHPASAGARKGSIWMDRALAGTGVALAFAAGLFPWYVFFHEEQFGVKLADWGNTRDLPDIPGRNVFSVSPTTAMVDNDDKGATSTMPSAVDPVVTATVSQVGKEDANTRDMGVNQPFPGRGGFRLLHVANGRALIEDGSGMYMVQVGSILPDNSKVANLQQQNGKWVIVSTTGEIYGSE